MQGKISNKKIESICLLYTVGLSYRAGQSWIAKGYSTIWILMKGLWLNPFKSLPPTTIPVQKSFMLLALLKLHTA